MRVSAQRISYLHEQEIELVLSDFYVAFRPDVEKHVEVVRHAISLVRKGAMSSYRYSQEDGEILVQLNDRASEFVRFSFKEKKISCTCGIQEHCVHQLAVVLDLYSQFHSLTEWFQEWRSSEKKDIALKITERTPEAWDVVFKKLMAPLRKLNLSVTTPMFTYECMEIESRVQPLMPFEYEWKPLFELYYRLYILDSAWEYVSGLIDSNQSHLGYGSWQLTTWLTTQISEIEKLARALGNKPKLFETDPFMKRLKELVYTICIENTGQFPFRFRIYESIWSNLFLERSEREAEKNKLANDSSKDAFLFSMYFAISEGRGDVLEETLTSDPQPEFSNWMTLAKFARTEELTTTAASIARGLYPFIKQYFSQKKSRVEQLAAVQEIDTLLSSGKFTDEEYEAVYSIYGKVGIPRYSSFLIERKRFTDWAALMHRFSVSFDNLEADELKEVLANQPSAALPLLHDYAMQFIAEKNRLSYRRAVKLFKRMRTACKKSGQIDFWNRYITVVREKHRRMRALVEEMERGNLEL